MRDRAGRDPSRRRSRSASSSGSGCASFDTRRELDAPFGEEVTLPSIRSDDWFFVETRVDGRGPLWFLLDTGASHSVVDDGLVPASSPRPDGPGAWGRVREIAAGPLVVTERDGRRIARTVVLRPLVP